MSQQPSRFEVQTNICLQVDEFDANAPRGGHAYGVVVSPAFMEGKRMGVRLMDKDECLGSFRKDKDAKSNDTFFKRRADIQQFQDGYRVGSNSIPPMLGGGLIMFHGSTMDRELSTEQMPIWKAQYMESYGNTMDRSILKGAGRVEVREHGGQTYANLDLLQTEEAVNVFSMSDVAAFYDNHMQGQSVEVGLAPTEKIATKNPIALIRVGYDDGGCWSRLAYSTMVEKPVKDAEGNDLTIKVPGEAREAMQAGFIRGEQGRGFFQLIGGALNDELFQAMPEALQADAMALRADLKSGKARIEMIPGMRIPIVGKSLDDLMNEKHQLNRVANKCWITTQSRDGGPDGEALGFLPMTVGVMQGKSSIPDQVPNIIVTKFTEDEFARARSANMTATPLFNPTFAQLRVAEEQDRARQAAQLGSVEHSSYEQHDPGARLEQEMAHQHENDREDEPAPGM